MDYVIMTTKEVQFKNGIELELSQSGNKYRVGIYNQNGYTHRNFSTLEDAMVVYCQLVKFIAHGLYSEKDRRAYLEAHGE